MKSEGKQKLVSCFILVLVLFIIHPLPAYANSSWHWFTKQPLTILPIVVVSTLFLEVSMICFSNHLKPRFVLIGIIVLANLFSFLFPVAALGIFSDTWMLDYYTFFERINYYIKHLPVYMVNIGFLFLTLIVEVPIVYLVLKKYVSDKKWLFCSTLVVNCMTTIIIAVIERILFKGSW